MGLLDLIRKPVIIASGILSLAGSLYAQDTWREYVRFKTAEGKDSCISYFCYKEGNEIVRRGSDGSFTTETDGRINGSGMVGYRNGMNARQSNADGSVLAGRVRSVGGPEPDGNDPVDNVPADNSGNSVNNNVSATPSVDALVENVKGTAEQAKEEFNIGKECYDRKDYQCAREHLEKATSLDQSNIKSFWTLAQTYRFLGKDFFDKALENYYICISKDHNKGDAYACVGGIFIAGYYKNQNKDKALEAWKKGAELNNYFCIGNLNDFDRICKEEGLR